MYQIKQLSCVMVLAHVNVFARVMVLACVMVLAHVNVLVHVLKLYVRPYYGVSTCYGVIPCSCVSLCYVVIPVSYSLRLRLSAYYG